ncbi:MAG: hypothetical protein ACTHMD_00185, partial [Flavisolibacter sp.]
TAFAGFFKNTMLSSVTTIVINPYNNDRCNTTLKGIKPKFSLMPCNKKNKGKSNTNKSSFSKYSEIFIAMVSLNLQVKIYESAMLAGIIHKT